MTVDTEMPAVPGITGASLINVKAPPAGLGAVRELAMEARAYNNLKDAYPRWAFQDWKTESRGPLPRCLPLARSIVRRGAKWLFGRAPSISFPGNEEFEKLILAAWKDQKMAAKLAAIARRVGIEGGVVFKFAYDETRKPQPLTIQALSLVDEARIYMDPHDCERSLMARFQYRYFDPVQNATYWYREEWTEEFEVHYHSIKEEQLNSSKAALDPDSFEGWTISSKEPNPFGVIPAVMIKNFETDDKFGEGDCWDLFRIMDRVNLTYHMMDRSNQFDSQPTNIMLDMEEDEQDTDQSLAPGQMLPMKSIGADEGQGTRQGKVIPIEPKGSMRPAMMDYARDLRKQVLDAASSVEVDQAEVSNRGNLTTAVLQQLYQPQIEITEEKRKSWNDGLTDFFARIAIGLQNAGVDGLGVNEDDPDTYSVSIGWQAYFEMSQDEKTAFVSRTQIEETAGYLTHERAVDRVAQAEGIEDTAALKEELEKEPEPAPLPPINPDIVQEAQEDKDLQRIGGKAAA